MDHTILPFDRLEAETPQLDGHRAAMRAIAADVETAPDDDARVVVLRRWDDLRRQVGTWQSLVNLRFRRDTRDGEAKRARDECDGLAPKLHELDVDLMRMLCAAPWRSGLERRLGTMAFRTWESIVSTYAPAIEVETVADKQAGARYMERTASARFEFHGQTLNLSSLAKFHDDPDRSVRHEAFTRRWDWFARNGGELDAIFDEQVRLRDTMARKLGYRDYVELGYRRMRRLDYGRDEVEAYRSAIRKHVVPLCGELRARQRATLGLDRLMAWDAPVHDPSGNPRPVGDASWMTPRAQEMFHAMGAGLGPFFDTMVEGGYLDLEAREGKAGGGFCTGFPTTGMPYIFANFNGTRSDVEVLTHEVGHAYQGHLSHGRFPSDLESPSSDACEIHSMSLEFLTWPHMELFFGADADRFRRLHLTGSILFLPYGAAIDEFQHRVYENPSATPAERHAIWHELESTYLPWRDWGDLAYPAAGGAWQQQAHPFLYPFYYIDYTLAQVCAFQYLIRMRADAGAALESYRALCARGGEEPFLGLLRSAGLDSPFEERCLAGIVDALRPELLG